MSYEDTYQNRNERIRETIDALAEYSAAELDQQGTKAEVAREHGLNPDRVYYVADEWQDLVRWRRANSAPPLSPEAVEAGYEEGFMQDLATDGGDGAVVDIGFTFNEAFRAMKLLPSDLGFKVYVQLLESTESVPPSVIRELRE